MMKGNSDIMYGAKDFERYHSGHMSGAEMYALEKAAIADPFLQEALEGYAYTQHAESDIDNLQSRLNNSILEKKEKRIAYWNKNLFLKAAVLIAFLAGAAFIFLMQNNKGLENNNLASSTPSEIKEINADKNQTTTTNDVAIQEQPDAAAAPVIELNKDDAENKIAEVVKPKPNTNPKSPSAKAESLAEVNLRSVAPNAKWKNGDGNFLVKGKVVNEQGEPIPFATILTEKEQINTDITGNYAALVKDSSIYGNVVASGYQPQQKQFNYNLPETIILKNEVAKADKVLQQKKSESAKAIVKIRGNASVSSQEEVTNNLLIPGNGWEAYKQYLQDSVRFQNDKRELVELSFTVNAAGRPQEIKVVDGLCLPCNQEAIRLLKDGPDWKPIPQGKGLLKVQF